MRARSRPSFGLMKRYAEEIASLIRKGGRRRHAGGPRLRRDGDDVRAAEGGLNIVGRPAGHCSERARDQERRRDPPAQPGGVDGRRRVSHDLGGDEAGRPRETTSSRWPTRCSTRWAPTTSRPSTPSPASAATRIRTISPTATSAPATRPSSTSCRATRAIAPATTAPSTSAAPRPRSATPTSRCRDWLDAAIALIKPGVGTRRRRPRLPRRARTSSGFPTELLGPSASSSAHGAGGWRSTSARSSSRVVSLENPMGDPDRHGSSRWRPTARRPTATPAARIEEEVVVTGQGLAR